MANPPGYDYAAFCAAIADRDGPGCFVHRLLAARRAAVIERWRTEGFGDVDRCAGWIPGGLLRCDGPLDGHHLLSKSWLKREFPHGAIDTEPVEKGVLYALLPGTHDAYRRLPDLLNDPRNGILACRRHHDLIERASVQLRAAELPRCVFEFAAELGDRAVGRLERDFGPLPDLGRTRA